MNPFREFPKLYRLFREVIVSEKIDGTNAQILVIDQAGAADDSEHDALSLTDERIEAGSSVLFAGSRNRFLAKGTDNFGFHAWVAANAEAIAAILGPGRHFGEWWGAGIQRRYGLDHKRFSLFNVSRWGSAQVPKEQDELCPPRDFFKEPEALRGGTLTAVPVLWSGPFSENDIRDAATSLLDKGSAAAPGFNKPEGIVVFHAPSGHSYKYTPFDGDGHKGDNRP